MSVAACPSVRERILRSKRIVVGAAVLGLLVASCGTTSNSTDQSTQPISTSTTVASTTTTTVPTTTTSAPTTTTTAATAAVSSSTWSRVPHDEAVFGGEGSQLMLSVTVGGPGLVAVGGAGSGDDLDAAVWVEATEA